jgi:excisionase family DNA binding protein
MSLLNWLGDLRRESGLMRDRGALEAWKPIDAVRCTYMAEGQATLLTVQEVAEILKVPVSWVYEHARGNGPGRLPHVKVGKYVRFLNADISRYLEEMRASDGRRNGNLR